MPAVGSATGIAMAQVAEGSLHRRASPLVGPRNDTLEEQGNKIAK